MTVNEQEHAIVIDEEKCIGCGICIGFCNVDAIAVNEQRGVVEVIDLEVCIECHSCQQNCPEGAIMVYPQVEDSLRNL